MHLVGFTIEVYTMHGPINVKPNLQYLRLSFQTITNRNSVTSLRQEWPKLSQFSRNSHLLDSAFFTVPTKEFHKNPDKWFSSR